MRFTSFNKNERIHGNIYTVKLILNKQWSIYSDKICHAQVSKCDGDSKTIGRKEGQNAKYYICVKCG